MVAIAPIPLSGWADAELRMLAALSGSAEIAALSGEMLTGERAAINGFRVPGMVSAGGGCRLYETSNGHVALNLSRADDREMLPALFGDAGVCEADLAGWMARANAAEIVARGRMLGMAIASVDEMPVSPACSVVTQGLAGPAGTPRVIDLSALWAGPLAGSLLRAAGADVVKIDSLGRPDSMRTGDPVLFGRLSRGKTEASLDLRTRDGREALIAMIRRAGIVIEAARPRALRQLGIDADALVREVPGLVWVTVTGHGIEGDAGDWVGFGDDCGVAGGLSAALRDTTGAVGFVGDAIADPLTGIHAARVAMARYRSGMGGRLIVSMSGVIGEALAAERARDGAALRQSLRTWADRVGRPFPAVAPRSMAGAPC